jgi:TetR/AcrR family transcriptional repressor of nem operon
MAAGLSTRPRWRYMMVIIRRLAYVPWPKEHKSRTRRRILDAAAGAFRARGVSGVRVDEIMADAGLTHGAFYAHFPSKEDLLAEAVEYAAAGTIELLSQALEAAAPEDRLSAVIDAYLSSGHAAHPERGCPVAALASELARSGKKIRARLARALTRRIEWMRCLMTPEQRETLSDAQLIGAMSCMVGGVILARSAPAKESEAILQSCREFLHAALFRPRNTRTAAEVEQAAG